MNREEYEEWARQMREEHDRSTAESIRKARKSGVLGNILAKQRPSTRKRIHDLDRRYNGGEGGSR